jgi:hypothetical protein
MIPRTFQSASGARVPSVAKTLWNSRSAQAGLGCATGIYLDKLAPSTLSLVREFVKETSPSSILYRLCQSTFGESFDIQVFHSNKTVAIYEHPRQFMVEVGSLVLNVCILSLKCLYSLAFAIRLLILATRETALRDSQFTVCLSMEAWVVNLGPVVQCGERGQAHVNTRRFRRFWQRCGVTLDRKYREPATGFTLDGSRLNLPVNGTMQFNFDFSNSLDVKEPTVYLAPVPMNEVQNIPIARRFESWEPTMFSTLHTSKERLKGLIEPPQNTFGTLCIRNPDKFFRSEEFKLSYLVKTRDRFSARFPCTLALFKSTVVKIARLTQLIGERRNLGGIGVKAVFE